MHIDAEFRKSIGRETMILGGSQKNLPYRGILKQVAEGYILADVSGNSGMTYSICEGDKWVHDGKTDTLDFLKRVS